MQNFTYICETDRRQLHINLLHADIPSACGNTTVLVLPYYHLVNDRRLISSLLLEHVILFFVSCKGIKDILGF